MSRQEMYAWAGLASAAAIAGYYVLTVIGLADTIGPVSEQLGSLLIRVILIAAGIELALDLLQSVGGLRIDKDERDRLVEGKSFRNAYYVLIVAVFGAIGHMVVTSLMEERLGIDDAAVLFPLMALHILVIGALVASGVNSASRLYFYRRGS